MDGIRFDAWTPSLRTRRTVVRALVAFGGGNGLARGVGAAPTPPGARLGCTSRRNTCKLGIRRRPHAQKGSDRFCVTDDQGAPFCAVGGGCAPCAIDADCAQVGPGAICVTHCPICRKAGLTTGCMVPQSAI